MDHAPARPDLVSTRFAFASNAPRKTSGIARGWAFSNLQPQQRSSANGWQRNEHSCCASTMCSVVHSSSSTTAVGHLRSAPVRWPSPTTPTGGPISESIDRSSCRQPRHYCRCCCCNPHVGRCFNREREQHRPDGIARKADTPGTGSSEAAQSNPHAAPRPRAKCRPCARPAASSRPLTVLWSPQPR